MRQFQITVITKGKREVLLKSFETSFDAAVWATNFYGKTRDVRVSVKAAQGVKA